MGQAYSVRGSTIAQVRAELGRFPLEATSADRAWRAIGVDRFGSSDAQNLVSPPRDHHLIALSLQNTPDLFQERCGRQDRGPSLAGEITIMPAGFKSRWNGRFPAHLCMRITADDLQDVADGLRQAGLGPVELCNGFRVRDPVLQHLGALINTELDRPEHPAQILLVESLAAALTVHLVRAHSAVQGAEPRPTLTVASSPVRRAIAYIGDRPFEAISLDELAKVAGLSAYHFAREFKKQVGQPPARYVEAVRIGIATQMLRTQTLPLCEIALAVGFSDQSHFTRRFKRHVGCTPGQYAMEYGRRVRAMAGR